MLKLDEIILMAMLQERDLFRDSLPNIRWDINLPSSLEISELLNIPYKRARYIILKWSWNNLYDYGVSWRVGWLTEEGKQVMPSNNLQTWETSNDLS